MAQLPLIDYANVYKDDIEFKTQEKQKKKRLVSLKNRGLVDLDKPILKRSMATRK